MAPPCSAVAGLRESALTAACSPSQGGHVRLLACHDLAQIPPGSPLLIATSACSGGTARQTRALEARSALRAGRGPAPAVITRPGIDATAPFPAWSPRLSTPPAAAPHFPPSATASASTGEGAMPPPLAKGAASWPGRPRSGSPPSRPAAATSSRPPPCTTKARRCQCPQGRRDRLEQCSVRDADQLHLRLAGFHAGAEQVIIVRTFSAGAPARVAQAGMILRREQEQMPISSSARPNGGIGIEPHSQRLLARRQSRSGT